MGKRGPRARFRNLILIIFTCIACCHLSKGLKCNRKEYGNNRTQYDCSGRGEVDVPTDIPQDTSEILLNNNALTKIETGTFENLRRVDTINLANNRIKTVEKNAFIDLPELKKVILTNNPLLCDCRMSWFLDFHKYYTISLTSTVSDAPLTCSAPSPVQGRPFTELQQRDLRCDCWNPGQLYQGTVNVTASGRECQPWGSQEPHAHLYGAFSQAEQNYCRNFDIEDPWCLTMNSSVKWEKCNVTKCEDFCYQYDTLDIYNLTSLKSDCGMVGNVKPDDDNCKILTEIMGALRKKLWKRGIECPSTFRLLRAAIVSSNTTFRKYMPCTTPRHLFREKRVVNDVCNKEYMTPVLSPSTVSEFCRNLVRYINCKISSLEEVEDVTFSVDNKREVIQIFQSELLLINQELPIGTCSEAMLSDTLDPGKSGGSKFPQAGSADFRLTGKSGQDEGVSYVLDCRVPGKLYTGYRSTTDGTYRCQPWEDQTPNMQNYDAFTSAKENFCRNFDREEAWCLPDNYTSKYAEPCEVPICGNRCYEKARLKAAADMRSCVISKNSEDCTEIASYIECLRTGLETINLAGVNCTNTEKNQIIRSIVVQLVPRNLTEKQRDQCYPSSCSSIPERTALNFSLFYEMQRMYGYDLCDAEWWYLNKIISDDAKNSPDICYETEKVNLHEKIRAMRLAVADDLTTTMMTPALDTSTLNATLDVYNGTDDTNETDCGNYTLELNINNLVPEPPSVETGGPIVTEADPLDKNWMILGAVGGALLVLSLAWLVTLIWKRKARKPVQHSLHGVFRDMLNLKHKSDYKIYEDYAEYTKSKADYSDYALMEEIDDPYATLGDQEEDPYNLIPDLDSAIKDLGTYDIAKDLLTMKIPRDFLEFVKFQTGAKLKFSEASLEALDTEYRGAMRDLYENEYTALGPIHEKDTNEGDYSNLDDVIAQIDRTSRKSVESVSCEDGDVYGSSQDDRKSQNSQNQCSDVEDDDQTETDCLIPNVSIVNRPKLDIPDKESIDSNDECAKVERRLPTSEHKESSHSSISLYGSDESLDETDNLGKCSRCFYKCLSILKTQKKLERICKGHFP